MGVCVALGYTVNFKHRCQRIPQRIPLSEKGFALGLKLGVRDWRLLAAVVVMELMLYLR